jgi:hypothetical protein
MGIKPFSLVKGKPAKGKNSYAFPAGFAPSAQAHNIPSMAISVFAPGVKIAY